MKIQKLNFSLIVLFFLFCGSPGSLHSQVLIDITMPGLGDGMAQLEGLLSANIGSAVYEVETLVNDLLEKPILTESFGTATGLSGTVPLLSNIHNSSVLSFGFGAYGVLYSDTFALDEITNKVENLDPEEDLFLGAGLNGVNSHLLLPMDFLIPRLSLFASLGYVDMANEQYSIYDLSVSGALNYSPFRKIALGRLIRWNPISVQAGFSYSLNRLGMEAAAGTFEKDFTIDPDGGGPLIGLSVSIEVDPIIDLLLTSEVKTITASAATSVTLWDFLHFYGGGGINFMFGETTLGIYSFDIITVLGYLSGLVETPGAIVMDGSVEGEDPQAWLPHVYGGVQMDFSHFSLKGLIFYDLQSGLGGGLSLGVSL